MVGGGTRGTPWPGLDGGGYPIQVWMVGGYPSQALMVGGTPARSGWWGDPGQVLMVGGGPGVPAPSRPGWGPPTMKTLLGYPPPWDGVSPTIKTWLGYPPPRPGMGFPPTIKTWLGSPPPPWDGVPSPPAH